MNRSLRNRVALYYSFSATLMFGVLLLLLYLVVHRNVVNHLDQDLDSEAREINAGIMVSDSTISFTNAAEWQEPEHWHVDVNPRFLQVIARDGRVLRRSQNLRDLFLQHRQSTVDDLHYNTMLSGAMVRQHQSILIDADGRIRGWLLIATPSTEAENTLADLRTVLWVTYPIAVLLLFLVGRFIAIRSMGPVEKLIASTEGITSDNLERRIELPQNKDELYRLTLTINELLDRLQDAVRRERQFTSDASHELRTPLAVLKGTMEVLIRKPRNSEQYEEKIRPLIGEVNRLAQMVDQLLLLARLEDGALRSTRLQVDLAAVITDVIRRYEPLIESRSIHISYDQAAQCFVHADAVMLDAMVGNLLSNAIKFTPESGHIHIVTERDTDAVRLRISDSGPGIPEQHLPHIFERFYRSDESRSAATQGTGLGLTIVRRLADLQGCSVSAENAGEGGSVFTISFPLQKNPGVWV